MSQSRLSDRLNTSVNRKAWDCDTCIADVEAVSTLMDSEMAADGLTLYLEGEAFCKAEDLGLTEEQMDVCDMYVKTGAVKGFQYIFKLVGDYAKDICTENYQVCEAKKLF